METSHRLSDFQILQFTFLVSRLLMSAPAAEVCDATAARSGFAAGFPHLLMHLTLSTQRIIQGIHWLPSFLGIYIFRTEGYNEASTGFLPFKAFTFSALKVITHLPVFSLSRSHEIQKLDSNADTPATAR
jgi:hypothetical protein